MTRKDLRTVVLVTAIAGASGAAAVAAASSVSTRPPPAYVSPTEHGAVDTPPAPVPVVDEGRLGEPEDDDHRAVDGANELEDREDGSPRDGHAASTPVGDDDRGQRSGEDGDDGDGDTRDRADEPDDSSSESGSRSDDDEKPEDEDRSGSNRDEPEKQEDDPAED